MVYLFLADGFEEIEAMTPVDTLRRANVGVQTVGIAGKTVTGAHGVPVLADIDGSAFELPEDAEMVVLPGGAGVGRLVESRVVNKALQVAADRGIYVAAICAAPIALYRAGLLDGKRVAVFPSVLDELPGTRVAGNAVEVDGKIITGRSAGVALQFSHALITALCGSEKADKIIASLYPENNG